MRWLLAASMAATLIFAVGAQPSPPAPKSCGPAPSPPHSSGCSGSKVAGEECTATCGNGYTGGSTTFKCKANGQYSGSLTCEPVSCGPAPSPPHSSGCSGTKHFPQQCTATCGNGYTGGSTSTTFTCEANGQYSGSLTCQGVSCGPAPSPPHSSGCSGPEVFPQECTANCDSGWTGTQPISTTFSCDANTEYSGKSLACQKVSCGKKEAPEHASWDNGGCDALFQEKCAATCENGWTGGSGHDSGSAAHSAQLATFTCDAKDKTSPTGIYSGTFGGTTSTDCNQPVLCPAQPPSPHTEPCPTGAQVPTSPGHNICSVACTNGYADVSKNSPAAKVEYTCEDHGGVGVWIPTGGAAALSCKAVTCDPLPGLNHQQNQSSPGVPPGHTCPKGNFESDKCSVACELGHHQEKPERTSALYSCLPKPDDPLSGQWTPDDGPLICTGYKCEGIPTYDTSVRNATVVALGDSPAGYYPSTLQFGSGGFGNPESRDELACPPTPGDITSLDGSSIARRGQYLVMVPGYLPANNSWNCTAKSDASGAEYRAIQNATTVTKDDGSVTRKPDPPTAFKKENKLTCTPCGGRDSGKPVDIPVPDCKNQAEDISCVRSASEELRVWEAPTAVCSDCETGYTNLGKKGCNLVTCVPPPYGNNQRTQSPKCTGPSEGVSGQNCYNGDDTYLPLSFTADEGIKQGSGTVKKLTTKAMYTCNHGHNFLSKDLSHSGLTDTYSLYCNALGNWVKEETWYVPDDGDADVPQNAAITDVDDICGICCTKGSLVESCKEGHLQTGVTVPHPELPSLKWYEHDGTCDACLPTANKHLSAWDWSMLVGGGLFVLTVVFVAAEVLKQMVPVVGPAMSLWSFMQRTYLLKSFADSGDAHDCVLSFSENVPFPLSAVNNTLCTSGILGAANFDYEFLKNMTSVGRILQSTDPHCTFDFNYDMEWLFWMVSPCILFAVLFVAVLLRVVLAVLCNWWLPPKYRREISVPRASWYCSRLCEIDTRRRDYVWFEERASRTDTTQPKSAILVTLLLAVPFGLLLVVWWTFWVVVLQILAKFGWESSIHPLLDVNHGPGAPCIRSELYKELKMHPGWIGFQKLVYCFASTDIRAMLNRLYSVLLFYLWSGYVNITKWSLEPLICPSGYIATRPSIQCDATAKQKTLTSNYGVLHWGGWICCVIYGIGIPFGCWWILNKAKHADGGSEGRLKDKKFSDTYGFMTTKMKEESPCYVWDVVVLVRKGVLALSTTYFSVSDSKTYYVLSLVVMVISIFAQQLYQPFALWDANLVESMTLLSSTLLLVSALARPQSDGSKQDESTAGAWVNFICRFFVFVTVSGTIVVIIRRMTAGCWRHKHKTAMAKKMEEKDDQRWANTNKTIIHTKYGYHNGQDLPCMRKLRDHVGDADYEMVQLWAAKELGDDDRDLIDKSQLPLAESWAQTDCRENVAEGKLILKVLNTFNDALDGNARDKFRQHDKILMSHFKQEFRPTLFAWIAQQSCLQQQLADAKKELKLDGSDVAFLRTYIQRLEQSLLDHKQELTMLENFVNHLRVTDDKQTVYVFKKCLCKCKCCTSQRPVLCCYCWPRWYTRCVRRLTHGRERVRAEFDIETTEPETNDHPLADASPHANSFLELEGAAPVQPEPEPEPAHDTQVSRASSPRRTSERAASATTAGAFQSRPVSPSRRFQATIDADEFTDMDGDHDI